MLEQEYVDLCHKVYGQMGFLETMGAKMTVLTEGYCEVSIPYSKEVTQQHGFVHGGAIATGMDTAVGFAANSVMPREAGVLTVEYKVNFLAPAKGEQILCIGKVVKTGKQITVASGEAYAVKNGERKLVAVMTATMMAFYGT
jgi:uncharacterized protein (TIGR00369 family)